MMIESKERKSAFLREAIRVLGLTSATVRTERFEIVATHPLNLLCMALRGGDAVTDRLIEAANATGTVLFTRTVLDGRSVLRFSIGARATEPS